MERVLTVLQEAGMRFPVIALAKEQKVPKYKLDALKQRFPDATFVNLNLEIDYDNGKSFNNLQIAWSGTKTVFRRATPFYRKVSKLFKKYRPAYCLSFWEPSVAAFINVMNCPTKLVTIASQGQILRDNTGVEKMLIVRALEQLAVGARGRSCRSRSAPWRAPSRRSSACPTPRRPTPRATMWPTPRCRRCSPRCGPS